MSAPPHEEESRTPVYLVLGATGGIGSEVCRRLTDKNVRVVAASRNQDKLSA